MKNFDLIKQYSMRLFIIVPNSIRSENNINY